MRRWTFYVPGWSWGFHLHPVWSDRYYTDTTPVPLNPRQCLEYGASARAWPDGNWHGFCISEAVSTKITVRLRKNRASSRLGVATQR